MSWRHHGIILRIKNRTGARGHSSIAADYPFPSEQLLSPVMFYFYYDRTTLPLKHVMLL